MKNMRVQHANGHRGAPRGRRAPLLWIVLGVGALFAVSAAPWALRGRAFVEAVQATAAEQLRERAKELIADASSIRLTPEQETVKTAALSSISAPCGNGESLAVLCCGCNLFKSASGLANHLIAEEGASDARVRQTVLDWIAATNPGGYSGAACERKRCERPFRADGCGGMSKARLVF